MAETTRQPKQVTAWWTADELAEITRRSPAAVRASIARGDVPAVRIGRRWFIDPKYFERQFTAAAAAVEARLEENH